MLTLNCRDKIVFISVAGPAWGGWRPGASPKQTQS